MSKRDKLEKVAMTVGFVIFVCGWCFAIAGVTTRSEQLSNVGGVMMGAVLLCGVFPGVIYTIWTK